MENLKQLKINNMANDPRLPVSTSLPEDDWDDDWDEIIEDDDWENEHIMLDDWDNDF